jgi:hypothetical protein
MSKQKWNVTVEKSTLPVTTGYEATTHTWGALRYGDGLIDLANVPLLLRIADLLNADDAKPVNLFEVCFPGGIIPSPEGMTGVTKRRRPKKVVV